VHIVSPQANEAQRFERLRAQDGKPLLPPPNLIHLCSQGGLNPAKVAEATSMWDAALAEVQTMPSFPAEERLFWTTFLLARHHATNGARPRSQQILETALPQLKDARHQQVAMGLLARTQAILGDRAGAMARVAQLDPQSEDLQIDTNYRFTVAYVALLREDAQAALQVLGWQIDDVPISDAYDHVCGMLRAHAHERLGRLDVAGEQLSRLAPTPQAFAQLESIVQANQPMLSLCPQSLAVARERIEQLNANVVVTRSGISVAPIVLTTVIGVPILIGVMEGAPNLFDPPFDDIARGGVVVLFILATLATVLRLVLRGPAQRSKLAHSGITGTAKLLEATQTGTRVNNAPVIRLRLLVTLPDRPPYTAVHHEIVPSIRLSQLVPGSDMTVRVDPTDPTIMAVAWA
jgi:hypothetical protein